MAIPGFPEIGPINRKVLREGIGSLKESIDRSYAEMTGDDPGMVAENFPELAASGVLPTMPPGPSSLIAPRRKGVTDEQTIKYQYKSVRSELMLLQKHLREGCAIEGVACDCCEKHPEQLEALAMESYGMTAAPVFADVANWARKIQPITTQEASESGQYAEVYPQLALEARQLIKVLMGSGYIDDVSQSPAGGDYG